jgi:hypothetical protein
MVKSEKKYRFEIMPFLLIFQQMNMEKRRNFQILSDRNKYALKIDFARNFRLLENPF